MLMFVHGGGLLPVTRCSTLIMTITPKISINDGNLVVHGKTIGASAFEISSGDRSIYCRLWQWILVTWTDDECKIILENYHKAILVGGKLIACEPLLPNDTNWILFYFAF